MDSRPHIAVLLENAFYSRVERLLRRRGWREELIAYTGYGNAETARVLARVLLTRDHADAGPDATVAVQASEPELEEAEDTQRGWRQFITAPAAGSPVRVRVGEAEATVHTNHGGYIDVDVRGHGLKPGWHEATLTDVSGQTTSATLRIVGDDVTIGVVSDIDDTVMVTFLPRMLLAAWNTFVRSESAREAVPGMAVLLRSVERAEEGAPVFYLSTGAWNTAPTLTRFLKRHGFPAGPLLMTDWGPTNTGWFRSGREHKRSQLRRLCREFPHVQWVLVGDDGQHDPMIYGEFTKDHPEAVAAVLIRELTTAQQILSHGLPIANDEILVRRDELLGLEPGDYAVPMLRAPEGYTLHRLLHRTLEVRRRFALDRS